ncbi:MAG: hypothetical protein JXR83_19345 [Deltaproteobacteria bacterium]|nr:hypothetical protein [Deltaproteobacteria bacterium]
MNKLSLLGAALLTALPLAARAAASSPPTCALAPSAAAEATLRRAKLLPALAAALQEADGCALKKQSRIAPELATARGMGFDCASDDTECLRKLAALLQVQRVIGVAAERKADALTLSLVLVDAKRGERLAAVEGEIASAKPARKSALRELARRLFAPESAPASQPGQGALVAREEQPAAVAATTGAPDQPASAEDGTASAEDGTASAEDGTASAEDGTASAEDGTAAAEDGTASAETGTASAETGTAAAETGTASAKSATPSGAKKTSALALDVVGWSIAGGAGGLALLGGLGALALDSTLLYSDAGDFEARSGMLLAERVLAGVAVVGVVAGAVGLGIALQAGGE